MPKKKPVAPTVGHIGIDNRGYHYWRVKRSGGKDFVVKRKDRTELLLVVQEKLKEFQRSGDLLPAGEEPNLEQSLRKWLRDSVEPNRRANTLRVYTTLVDCHIVPNIGKLRPSQLATRHLQEVVASMQRKGLGSSSIRQTMAVMSSFLGKRKWQEISDGLKLPSTSEPRERVLSMEEIHALIAEADKGEYRDRHLIVFLLNTGLRISEALALTWNSVGEGNQYVRVHVQLSSDGKSAVEEVKTRAGKRIVFLNDPAKEAVEAEWEHKTGIFVFATKSGKPRSQRNVLRSLQTMAERAGIPDLTIHDLRRTNITMMAANEHNPKVVQVHAGHGNIQTTYKHYIMVGNDSLQEAVSKVSLGRKR